MSVPKKTILLVEDEAISAMTEKFALEKYGYAVLHVTTGEKAIEAVETIPEIELILMDIDLGSGIDGTQAAETILKSHVIPIVFVSSHSEREVVEKTEKITSYGYVVKNSSITVLDASIKMAFKLFEAYKQVQKRSIELYERTQLLENILEHFPGTVFWKDTDLVYQGCNTGFAQAAGLCNSSEIIGKTDFELPWNSSEAPSYRADDSQVMSSMVPKLHIEETQHCSDGQVLWIDTSKIPLFGSDKQVIGVLGVSTDTTEKKRQESHTVDNGKQIAYIAVKEDITERERILEELHESNERYKQLLDSIPLMIWESGADGLCSYVNIYQMQFTGRSLETQTGDGWLSNVHPDDREQCIRISAEAFANRSPVVAAYRLRRFDGEYIRVLDQGNPRYSSTGQFLGFTGVCVELNQTDPCTSLGCS